MTVPVMRHERDAHATDDAMPDARLLAIGKWSERSIQTTFVPSSRRILPAVESAIDAAWQATLVRPGVRLFDGPVCRLESFAVDGDRLSLAVSQTSYRVNVGTNFCNPHFADTYGTDVMANPIGVSSGVISADGYLILGRRNGSVAYYPHMLHPFAGSLEVRPTINVFDDARRELHEELGFGPADLASLECVGIGEDLALRHPELLFIARSTRTRAEIQARVDPDEHGSSEAFPLASLAEVVTRDDVTPIGKAVVTRVASLFAF